jgi:hypothetical protein
MAQATKNFYYTLKEQRFVISEGLKSYTTENMVLHKSATICTLVYRITKSYKISSVYS